MADEWDVSVAMLPAAPDIEDDWHDAATAQQVNHPVQEGLLQLQLHNHTAFVSDSSYQASNRSIDTNYNVLEQSIRQ